MGYPIWTEKPNFPVLVVCCIIISFPGEMGIAGCHLGVSPLEKPRRLLPFIFLINKMPTFSIFFLDFMMIHFRFSIPWDSRGNGFGYPQLPAQIVVTGGGIKQQSTQERSHQIPRLVWSVSSLSAGPCWRTGLKSPSHHILGQAMLSSRVPCGNATCATLQLWKLWVWSSSLQAGRSWVPATAATMSRCPQCPPALVEAKSAFWKARHTVKARRNWQIQQLKGTWKWVIWAETVKRL